MTKSATGPLCPGTCEMRAGESDFTRRCCTARTELGEGEEAACPTNLQRRKWSEMAEDGNPGCDRSRLRE
eukprot:536633-Pleurochrysis_carterae.AAC.1